MKNEFYHETRTFGITDAIISRIVNTVYVDVVMSAVVLLNKLL